MARWNPKQPRATLNEGSEEEVARVISRTLADIGEMFASKGEKFEDEDVEKLTKEDPKPAPHFPMMIVSAAIIKDILDVPADLSLIGVVVAFLLSIAMSMILTIWTFNKISGGWWKKALIRWLWMLFFGTMVIEFIPFVQMIPANTIFVLMAHYKEKKIVKLFDAALEKLHASGAFRYMR